LDVRNPKEPKLTASIKFSDIDSAQNGITYGTMSTAGNVLLVARVSKEIYKIDISSPANPVIVATGKLIGDPIDISMYSQHAYVTETDTGVQIFSVLPGDNFSQSIFFNRSGIRGGEAVGDYF